MILDVPWVFADERFAELADAGGDGAGEAFEHRLRIADDAGIRLDLGEYAVAKTHGDDMAADGSDAHGRLLSLTLLGGVEGSLHLRTLG